MEYGSIASGGLCLIREFGRRHSYHKFGVPATLRLLLGNAGTLPLSPVADAQKVSTEAFRGQSSTRPVASALARLRSHVLASPAVKAWLTTRHWAHRHAEQVEAAHAGALHSAANGLLDVQRALQPLPQHRRQRVPAAARRRCAGISCGNSCHDEPATSAMHYTAAGRTARSDGLCRQKGRPCLTALTTRHADEGESAPALCVLQKPRRGLLVEG